jgi:CRP-like cAMP-binding protein
MLADLVRLADAEPDLVAALPDGERELARRALVAEVCDVPAGTDLTAADAPDMRGGALGLLVLRGLIFRRVELAGRVGVEILGPGDVVRPWECAEEPTSVPADVRWTVHEPTRFAILDGEVHSELFRFPPVLTQLTERLSRRANTLALNLALARLPRVDQRLLVLFWHLADRFGHVAGEGVVVPLRLSHELLAELVFAQRPSVTRSLHALGERRRVLRRPGGDWLLLGEPPSEMG